MRALILILLILSLGACKAREDPNLRITAESHEKAQQQLSAAVQKIADPSGCTDDRCRENRASMGAVALIAGLAGGGARGVSYTPAPTIGAIVANNLTAGLVPSLVSGAVNVVQSNNARRIAISNDTLQGQTTQAAFGLGAAAVSGNSAAITGLGSILPGLVPSIEAAGDVFQGPTQIHNGDAVAGNNVRDGSQVGHNLDRINTGTQIENAGNMGENNRQDAPGPFTDNNNGPRCEGPQCQQVTPPAESEGNE